MNISVAISRHLPAAIALALLFAVSGCFLAASREINLLVTRTETGGSEVTVSYRVPPPEDGEVYVLWIVNGDLGKTTRVGTVEPSTKLRAIKTRVDFWATAAVVSIESSAEAFKMSSEWALVSGEVGPAPKGNATPAAK